MGQVYVTAEQFFESGLPEDFFSDLPSETIERIARECSSLADSYLRKRHTLPLVTVGEDLRGAVIRLMAGEILTYRGFSTESKADMAIMDRASEARTWLRDVAKGLVEIEGVDATPDLDENGPQIAVSESGRSRLWTRSRC